MAIMPATVPFCWPKDFVIKEVFVEVIKEVEVTTTTTTEDNIKRLSYIKPD